MLEKMKKIYNQEVKKEEKNTLKVEILEEEFKTILTYSIGIE